MYITIGIGDKDIYVHLIFDVIMKEIEVEML